MNSFIKYFSVVLASIIIHTSVHAIEHQDFEFDRTVLLTYENSCAKEFNEEVAEKFVQIFVTALRQLKCDVMATHQYESYLFAPNQLRIQAQGTCPENIMHVFIANEDLSPDAHPVFNDTNKCRLFLNVELSDSTPKALKLY